MKVIVCPFDIVDYRTLSDLRLESLKTDPQAFSALFEKEAARTEEEWRTRWLKTQGKDRSQAMAIAKYGDKAIGMAGAHREDDPSAWRIFGVFVSPAFRRQGIARKLMEEVLAQIETMPEVRQINLMVNSNQRSAVDLYERMGFKVEKVLKDEKMGDGKRYDEYYMVRFRK